MKTALITGISGQDGCYLAKLLLDNGYKVYGTTREKKREHMLRFHYLGIHDRLHILETDLLEFPQLLRLLEELRPTEIYHLAAQSSVGMSFQQPLRTLEFNVISTANLLEAMRLSSPESRYYQASSSEMFGNLPSELLPVDEQTLFRPVSPYAISKASAHWLCVSYRDSFDLHIACGILFNHESPLRGDRFVTKKILKTALEIHSGKPSRMTLGNLKIRRDWGYAPLYVHGMWQMLQNDTPSDYILASGEAHTLEAFVRAVFNKLDLAFEQHVEVDETLFRPNELEVIYGNNNRAKDLLGWDYTLNFNQFIDRLVDAEMSYRHWCLQNPL